MQQFLTWECHKLHNFMDSMTVMTSICLYGTVYDLHSFMPHHKWQYMSSMFFSWRSNRDRIIFSTPVTDVLCCKNIKLTRMNCWADCEKDRLNIFSTVKISSETHLLYEATGFHRAKLFNSFLYKERQKMKNRPSPISQKCVKILSTNECNETTVCAQKNL